MPAAPLRLPRHEKRSCPECRSEDRLAVLPSIGSTVEYFVCEQCAAISVDHRGKCRGLLTQQWLDFVSDPRYIPALEARAAALDRATAPAAQAVAS